jgi:DNA polymerase I-like protein with 3'-5' exonuclease and polymerase domains
MMGDPSYAEEVVNGDIHTTNQKAAGLDTRSQAKTFIYALLYGGGDAKVGSITGGGAETGRELKTRFFKALPALGKLIHVCQSKADDRGYLVGLDGRKLHSRSIHSSLNLLLQSTGALVCKQWLIEADKLFSERSLDVQWHAWVHDEAQVSCPPDQADAVGQAFQDAMRQTQAHFNFKCQLDTDFSVGSSWAETH